jgi:hypothetical protein
MFQLLINPQVDVMGHITNILNFIHQRRSIIDTIVNSHINGKDHQFINHK